MKTKTIVLQGQPLSTNHLYFHGRGRTFMKADGVKKKNDYHYEAQQQWREKPIEHDNIELNIDLYFGDRRKRDWDNYNKIVSDAFNGIVWRDDSQVKKATITKNYSKESPCIIVDIKY